MSTILIICALSLFTLVCLRRRDLGIYLVILLLPTYQIRWVLGGIPMTFLEALILILAVVEFGYLLKRGELRATAKKLIFQPTALNFFLILFLLAALVSIFVSPVPIKAAGIFKAYFLESILFYFLVLAIIQTPKQLKGLLLAFSFLVIYLSVFGIYQFFSLANLPFSWWAVNVASRRIISLLNHPNALALLLGPILGLVFFSPFNKKLKWLALTFGVLALYLTFSRAAWLALVLALLAVGLFTKSKKQILAGLLIGVALVLAIPYSRAALFELTTGKTATQENRYVLWQAAGDMLKKSPLAGVGLMGFHKKYQNYPLGPDRVVQNYPHNFFLNFWVETGLLGFVAIIGLLIIFYKKTRKIMQGEYSFLGIGAAAAMTVIILHGLVDVSYFKNDLSVLFWVIFSLPNLTFLEN